MQHSTRLWIGALAVLVCLALAGQAALAEDGIIYVDANAAGANNGTTWADAFTTLQPALDIAVSGDQIWVAAGTYTPTWRFYEFDPRAATFQLKNDVALYGGFAGGEDYLEQREWTTNQTILSGDIGTVGVASDNSYHVFYHPGEILLNGSAILDGFTITGGNANYEYPHNYGGGMYNSFSSPWLLNCTFTGNSAIYGGGMFNDYGGLSVYYSTFSGNSATKGGGMYNQSNAQPHLIMSTISGNSASEDGGGVYNYYAMPDFYNSTLEGNTAGNNGGGMYNAASSPSFINTDFLDNAAVMYGGGMYNFNNTSSLVNGIFSGNTASGGGGMYNNASAPRLTNCTFSGNAADNGAGLFNSGGSAPVVVNSILWGDGSEEIYNDASTTVVTYSDIQGGYAGEGNIDADPLFWDAANLDFHIEWNSACVDAGDNDAPNIMWFDYEGETRPLDGDNDGTAIVDIGADELTPPREVEIDIKPTSTSNVINLDSKSTLAVAILTTPQFNASTVNPASVLFAGADVARSLMQDVDGDGDVDLLMYFKIQELELDQNSTEATLTGETYSKGYIWGTDKVKIR